MRIFNTTRSWNDTRVRIVGIVSGFVVTAFLVFGIFVFAGPVFAQGDPFGLGYGANIGLSTRDVRETIVNIIRISLGILGVLALGIVLYGGFVWMTAGGKPDRIDLAKKILINGAIGLLIIMVSFSIVQYIFGVLQRGTGLSDGSCIPINQCVRCNIWCNVDGEEEYNPNICGTQALCGGVPGGGSSMTVRWTSPRPDETGWPLCRIIQVYFSHDVDPQSVTDSSFKVTVADAIKGDGTSCSLPNECRSGSCLSNVCVGDSVSGSRSVVGQLIRYVPSENYLSDTRYRITVESGSNGVKSASGNLELDRRYEWTFTTGDTEDTEPPIVDAHPVFVGEDYISPRDGATDVCLASPVQVVFSEPMDVETLLRTGIDPNDPSDVNSIYIQPPLLSGVTWNKNAPNDHTLSARATDLFIGDTLYAPTLDADVIADACGNFLDGDKDGTAELSVGGDDYGWSFETGTTAQCTPEISSIAPASGYYEDTVTIFGDHFTDIPNEVVFYNNVYSDNRCFDSTSFPQEACFIPIDWQNTQITLGIPAKEGNSSGAISGNVQVEVAGSVSNGVYFDILSPHINSGPSPRKGGAGQYITLNGANFGSSGTVYLRNVLDPMVEYAASPTDCAVSTWSDTQVVVKIPEGGAVPLGFYYIQIEDAAGKRSNIASRTFEVTNDAPGPGLCSISEDCPDGSDGGIVDDTRTLIGVRFGSSGGDVQFRSESVDPSNTVWGDTSISTKVPAGIVVGDNPVVVIDSSSKRSNTLAFKSPCSIGVSCDSDPTTWPACEPGLCPSGQQCTGAGCTCEAIQTRPRVIDKWPTCSLSCTNVDIGAAFDIDMDPATIDGRDDNIDVRPCGSDCTIVNLGAEIGYSAIIYDSATRSTAISPSSPLAASTQYRVILYDAITSDIGERLGGLNFDRDEDGTNDSYSWTFATKDSGCVLSGVNLSPANATADSANQQIQYNSYSEGSNQQCGTQPINRWLLDWSWNSSNSTVADISSDDINSDSLIDPRQNATVIDEGQTIVTAQSGGFSADGLLTVTFNHCSSDADCDACTGSSCDTSIGLCKPSITNLSPAEGPVGRWTTVQGCYFGSSQGTGEVTFNGVNAKTRNLCGSGTWSNNQIIAEVPSVPLGTSDVQVITDLGLMSNTSVFEVTNDCSGAPVPPTGVPALCSVIPPVGNIGDSVREYGWRFGSTEDIVTFQGFSSRLPATILGWNSGAIDTEVPDGTVKGNVIVEVDACPSNGVLFTPDTGGLGSPCSVGTDGAGQCIPSDGYCDEGLWCNPESSCVCENIGDPTASFVPVDGSSGVCLNAELEIQFDQLMDIPSIASSTRPGIFLEADIPSGNCSDYGYSDSKVDDDNIYIGGMSLWKRLVLGTRSFLRNIFGKAYAQSSSACRVPFDISFDLVLQNTVDNPTTCDSFDGKGCTRALLSPRTLLRNDVLGYRFGVIAYPADSIFGAKSKYGKKAVPASSSFTTGQVCQIDEVEVTITPPGRAGSSDLFLCAGKDTCPGDVDSSASGNQHFWQALAYTNATNPRSLVSTSFLWDEKDDSNLYSLAPSVDQSDVYITASVGNGSATFSVGAYDPIDLSGSATTTIYVSSSMCDNPWPGPVPYTDSTYNYSFWYCKDGGLPDLQSFIEQSNVSICNIYSGNSGSYCSSGGDCTSGAKCVSGICNEKSGNPGADCSDDTGCSDNSACESDLLEDKFIKPDLPNTTETIGLKVFKNSRHLSSKGWYHAFSINPGGGSGTSVNGYEAIKSGRTVYVASANDKNGTIYTNVFLFSYSQNAGSVTKNIYNQILNNLKFNINITDATDLARLRRDTERIGDLGMILNMVESYKGRTGGYPKLSAGTYVKGLSTSKWPSWQGTFGSSLGGRLPVDPLNIFESVAPDAVSCSPPALPEECGLDTSTDPATQLCCDSSVSQCSASNSCVLCPAGYDLSTCWSESERMFFCPEESHIYMYEYDENEATPSLYANLEYTAGSWAGLTLGTFNDCFDLKMTN